MQRYFQGEFTISNKEGINNLVTEADHASEKAIFEVIRHDFPDHFLLSEESGEVVMDSNFKWIIDPIDGTVNFAHGLPICCVSIGIEQEGEMIMGAVYNPFINEFYFAQRGYGATLNDKKIAVSERTFRVDILSGHGFPVYLPGPAKWPAGGFLPAYPGGGAGPAFGIGGDGPVLGGGGSF